MLALSSGQMSKPLRTSAETRLQLYTSSSAAAGPVINLLKRGIRTTRTGNNLDKGAEVVSKTNKQLPGRIDLF